MAKMNRRDCLLKIGAGAGLLVTGGAIDVPARKRKRPGRPHRGMVRHNPPTVASVGPQKPNLWLPDTAAWPPYGDDTCVRLIFVGLMGFTHVDNYTCDVGFHLKNDGQHNHELSVHGYEGVACNDRGKWERVGGRVIGINIDQPELSGVSYFQPNPNIQSRAELLDHDFRWIIDFDSDYLYGKHFAPGTHTLVKKGIYKPTLTLKNGFFYTLRKTASTFRAQTSNGVWVSDLGKVADVIAANIYLKNGGKITLSSSSQNDIVVKAPGEIYFRNHCYLNANKDECIHEPHNVGDKTRRSDFYLNYQAFDHRQGMKESTDEYQLYLHDSYTQTVSPGRCEGINFESLTPTQREHIRLTDESPCAAVGYGDAH